MKYRFSLLLILAIFSVSWGMVDSGKLFYVDPVKGKDTNPGTITKPFQTIDKALSLVGSRVNSGIISDKIYLRGGVYRKESSKTLYNLRLKGTKDDFALLSAMPCSPGAPGAIQRKSGKWYERVIFDAAQTVKTRWVKDETYPGVWETKPGYTPLEWIHTNLWPWTWYGFPITKDDNTPKTTSFTVGPCMILQDNNPLIWKDSVQELTSPGLHTYDQTTGTLYISAYEGKDPNNCKIESWYGGPEEYDEGILYLDGEGRAIFKGNMEYAGIVGCEFRMFVRLFEFQRRGYLKEEDREIQRHVLIEDNVYEYGWIHFLLDANTIYSKDDVRIRPRFEDRSDWLVRNNIFYRPSREVFQVHGANHIFEYNEVIDHIGPWAGPAACVGIMNDRNMKNFIVRYNYINGNGVTKYSSGSFIEMEVNGTAHKDLTGDYINGPTLFENNLITNFTSGITFVLGKGNIRMRNVTIRNNILGTDLKGPGILIWNPQQNLIIENNLFYENKQVLGLYYKGEENPMKKPMLPSTVTFRNNMFVNNNSLLDNRLFDAPEGSIFTIDHNLFYNNADSAIGTNRLIIPVEFFDPENFDFRIKSPNAREIYDLKLGPYKSNDSIPQAAQWWVISKNARKSIKPGI
jgi:hypothetical protein